MMKGCVDIYEDACKERKEHKDLAMKLERTLKDLAEYMKQPIGSDMSNSVRRIYCDLEDEAKKVSEKQAIATGRLLIDALEGSDGILESHRRIDDLLGRLSRNTNMSTLSEVNRQAMDKDSRLDRMSPAKSAMYNSAESHDIKRGSCAPQTREVQIRLLLDWACTPESGRTCWINGMAGTGKTTIAHTVCTKLDEACALGASFFCSRVIPECRQAKYIIPSIAYQLARFSVTFHHALDKVLQSDRDAHSRTLDIQYKKLIVEPLLEAKETLPADFIVVIDALDECENEETVGQILDLILSPKSNLPIRFLVSSRPEREITQRMSGRANEHNEAQLVLHDLNSDTVKADIALYMRHELRRVPLNDDQWEKITASCGNLFIYASTICRYIEEAYKADTLDEVVSGIVGAHPGSAPRLGTDTIDQLYRTILENAFNNPKLISINVQRTMKFLQMVVYAIEPLTTSALASLLALRDANQVEALLKPLRSVLNITQETGLVTTLHASFPDFMLSPNRSGRFHCHPSIHHGVMAEACLRTIDATEPKFNICALPSSYLYDHEVPDLEDRISRSISPGLTYACQYWTTHLELSEHRDELIDGVRNFFSLRLLLWMEVMNLTSNMHYSAKLIIRDAERWCFERNAPEDLMRLAHDAWEFVSFYKRRDVSKSTPHIYVSMLPFWPRHRPISTAYMPRTSGLVQPTGAAINQRELALKGVWRVSENGVVKSIDVSGNGNRLVAVTGSGTEVIDATTGANIFSRLYNPFLRMDRVAISPDGTKVAFGASHRPLHIWNIGQGGLITTPLPNGTRGVESIAYSPDGFRIACGFQNGDVYIYGLQQEAFSHGPLKGHTSSVWSVAFAPNSLHLASASKDNTVQIWDVQTGQRVGDPLEGQSSDVMSMSYFIDGPRLAFASWGLSIRVWNPQTRRDLLGPLTGHSSPMSSIAFSPNGAFVASASSDGTILVHDAQSGQIAFAPLKGHTRYVNSVIFSTDSARLFSSSNDGTVRIWNIQDLNPPDTQSPTSALSAILSIRYSHDGLRVVSGSEDGAVHVWEVRTGNMVLGPLRGHDRSIKSVDFSSDDAYILSGSDDKTVRIWDASTGQDIHGPMRGHDGRVGCVRFSPDNLVVFSGSRDGTVRIWDVSTGQQLAELFRGNLPIQSVGISPDGQLVACGFKDGCIRVIDGNTGDTLLGPIKAYYYNVTSVDFSPNGMRLVSGSIDSVKIWDAQTGEELVVCGDSNIFSGKPINSVSFSPNDLYVVSGSDDRTVCVRDAQNGNLILGPLKGHTGKVTDVQFSPDGSHIVSCSQDGMIWFWDVSILEKNLQQRTDMGAGAYDLDYRVTGFSLIDHQ
ncbi:Vegetative incompatibility protein HET-E-1 [Rhizoctonia solani AG-1 IB]|uniref:Vegetative incompatibility protein HET-E-1 n=1 Tax=Thanatephorus cucumeris (strain AG1-IB / isolate 7/3/14) TaxID=1108050 RepID=M5C845_THACB|nr:Vegetative incompatibility protein HET-E-1 [Rhizoctonia solani AG-1 IB]